MLINRIPQGCCRTYVKRHRAFVKRLDQKVKITENGAYKDAMKAPNGTYSIKQYQKQSVAMILNSDNGAEGIANGRCKREIGDPVDKWNSGGDKEGGVLAVESRYSWNSLDDYTDNIYSIRNAYYGSFRRNCCQCKVCALS